MNVKKFQFEAGKGEEDKFLVSSLYDACGPLFEIPPHIFEYAVIEQGKYKKTDNITKTEAKILIDELLSTKEKRRSW